MMMSSNAISKSHIGHFTWYSKSVVRDPKNIYIASDVFSQRYCKGDGVKFFDTEQLEKCLQNDSCGGNEQTRDMYVIEITENTVMNPIDITGKCPSCCSDANAPCFHEGPGHTNVTEIIRQSINACPDEREMCFNPPFHWANRVCYRGAYKTSKDKGNSPTSWTCHQDTGMWGPGMTYPGCRRVRDGGYETPNCPRDECC